MLSFKQSRFGKNGKIWRDRKLLIRKGRIRLYPEATVKEAT